jgi:hypothetical protein
VDLTADRDKTTGTISEWAVTQAQTAL